MCVCVCVCVCYLLSHVCLFVTLGTAAFPPLSMRFSRQECWSGLPFPSLSLSLSLSLSIYIYIYIYISRHRWGFPSD